MLIETTRLYELDEVAERKRLTDLFKGSTQKALLACFEAFVSQRWVDASEMLANMTRERLECLNPVVFKVLGDIRARENLQAVATVESLAKAPEWLRIMGGIDGGCVSMAGVDYPKFKVKTDSPPATTEQDALSVLADMAQGWSVAHNPGAAYLTESCNKAKAWHCVRTEAPYCDDSDMRMWSGPTPMKALQLGKAALFGPKGKGSKE